jgi:hypothetical protein
MSKKWKFRHEDHNRQAKAHAPDYKEDLLVETIQHSSADHLEERRKDREYKQHIIESFRSGMFFRGACLLRLEWTLQQFEAANSHALGQKEPSAQHFFDAFHKDAEQDLKTIIKGIQDAPVEWKLYWNGERVRYARLMTVRYHDLRCDGAFPERTRKDVAYPDIEA